MSTDRITWIKAAASGSSGNCVEFGTEAGNQAVVYLRDSKNKQGRPDLQALRDRGLPRRREEERVRPPARLISRDARL